MKTRGYGNTAGTSNQGPNQENGSKAKGETQLS